MNLNECRQVTRRMWTSVYRLRDECRQMWMSVGESNIFTLISEKVTHRPFCCCCCNYATVGHIMQIFNVIVSSVIIAHHSVLTPHISKTHLPISLLNVRVELN